MNFTNDFDQNNHGNFQQLDSSQVYKPNGHKMSRHSKNQKKQITNFVTSGNELEVYRSDNDDELDDLADCFAKNSFIYDSDPEENLERAVATCDEAYESNNDYFANCDDQGGYYQVESVFYEDGTDLSPASSQQPNKELGYFDPHQQNLEQSNTEPSGSHSASFYWGPFGTAASCSFSDQPNTDASHKPCEEEKLTGLELVPYESEDENDRPTLNSRFKPDFDFDDLSQFKENILGADPYEPDDSHDELLENYKKEFRNNFPELFRKKKRKEKANLRNLLYGEEESGPRKRPKSRGSDASYGPHQLNDETASSSHIIEQVVYEEHLTCLPDSAFENLFE